MDALCALTQKPLELESGAPLYQQLEQRILQLVATGAFDDATPLPTEAALCKAFGLSRATVRRCFKDLVDEGHVVRRRGQGTFVSHGRDVDGISYSLNFSAEMEAQGRVPSSRILRFCAARPHEAVAKRLRLTGADEVWEISRLRMADGCPMRIESVYIPKSLLPGLTRRDLTHSLYGAIAERTGLMPASAREAYEAITLSRSEAKVLEQPAGSPAFRRVRTTFDAAGAPFEASIIIEPGLTTRFIVDLDDRGAHFRRTTL